MRLLLLHSGQFGSATAALLPRKPAITEGPAACGFSARFQAATYDCVTLICSNPAACLLGEYNALQEKPAPALLAVTLGDWELRAVQQPVPDPALCVTCRDATATGVSPVDAPAWISHFFQDNPDELVHPYPPMLPALAAHWVAETWHRSQYGLAQGATRRYRFWTGEVLEDTVSDAGRCRSCSALLRTRQAAPHATDPMRDALRQVWMEYSKGSLP